MQNSGLILDSYDDLNGDVLRQIYPSMSEVPGHVKTAQRLTSDDLDSLPDSVFALVLTQGDTTLRKFACIDPGATELNVRYLLKTACKLPKEAAKLAASNLLVACGWYDIDPPEELRKMAFIGPLLSVATKALPVIGKVMTGIEGVGAAGKAAKGLADTGSMIKSLSASTKTADVTGTSTMPMSDSVKTPAAKKAVIDKTGSIGRIVSPRREADTHYPKTNYDVADAKTVALARSEQVEGQPPGRQYRGNVMFPNIEVSGKDGPEVPVYEKKAQKTALNGRYPLDDFVQIKRAAAYFDEYGVRLSPEERHTYCVSMVKVAASVGIEVSDEARKYGSESYAPAEEIKLAMDVRKQALRDERHAVMLDALLEKRAALSPDLFCATLAQFDQMTGLHHYYGQYVPDPYWSTFGETKTAEFEEVIGNEVVTEKQIKQLMDPGDGSGSAIQLVTKTFGPDFAKEFRNDPIGIFKSLPRDQKLFLMRLANDNAPSGMSS